MKKYEFKKREACQKFLTCLEVQVKVPSEEALAFKQLNTQISYEVWMEGKACHQAIATDGKKQYVFYRKLKDNQTSSHSKQHSNQDLEDTIQRLRSAYKLIKTKGGKE